ncbi:sensor histidine kinase [Anatilimnocola sp. NA78]|uniref:sensor histidine kinase n=1 Tax=Anatilimnocola sp. NA78 TaxID=3415683 RepID=UPI003CE53376
MRRPWHYWATFLLGLALVLPAFAWLTIKAMELDQANALARRQAELEQDIGRALWRMDALLTPLLAQEAARPDFVYRTRYATLGEEEPASKGASKSPLPVQTLSPLVAEPPPFVLLHFEVLPDGCVVSPQAPEAKDASWALANGAQQQTLSAAAERLHELQLVLADMPLADQLPQETLPLAGMVIDNNAGNNLVQNSTNPPIYNRNYTQPNAYGNNLAQQQVQPENNSPSQNPAQQPLPPPQAPEPPVQSSQMARGPGQTTGQQGRQQSDFSYEQQLLPTGRDGQQLTQAETPNQVSPRFSGRSQSRAGNDLENRDAALQAFAQKAVSEQRLNQRVVTEATPAVEGVSQPLWLGGRLLLARRVQVGNQVRVQGCWLDWDALQQRLKDEVADLLPNVELTPVTSTEPIKLSRLLASLPVQLTVPMPNVLPAPFSPIRVSLLIAWSCLLIVSIAAAITLQSVVTLSERRASFVSAVTHELRTPLTTFRMYAEMLAGGMVPEAEQRQHYLETLRVEADRLAHLVDNVLQYARLERTNPSRRRHEVAVHELFDRHQERLADRARQAEMKLVVNADSCAHQTLVTDPQAVEQILFNLVDNACKYACHAAKKEIEVTVTCQRDQLLLCVRDFGPGISTAGRKKLFRPFSKSVHDAAHSAPGVGLGLALCERLARDLGGRLKFQPAEPGSIFCLRLPLK